MKKFKMMYVPILFFVLLIFPKGVHAATYKDVPKNHPSFEAIDYLSEKGIISGFANQTFRPNEQVTRGQATKMIIEALERQNYLMKEVVPTPIYFSDVPVNSWYYPYATKMSATKYMSGYGNHAYRLHQPIRRDEFSKILIQSFQLPLVQKNPYYEQVNQKLWSYPFIQAVTYYDILPFQKKGFYPSKLLTRGEVARMLYQSILAVEKHQIAFQGVQSLAHHPNLKIQSTMKEQEKNRKRWVSEKNVSRFSVLPTLKKPVQLGALTPAYENQLLDLTKYVRSLVGLNQPVSITDKYRTEAQAAALVSAFNGKIDHYPNRPPGMPDALFLKGERGAKYSNLAGGYLSGGDSLLYGYMMDEGFSNRSTLGHRRWILSPGLQHVGFGEALGSEVGARYYAMKVFDGGFQELSKDSPAYIAYPSSNAFPKKLFIPLEETLALPWSVTVSPHVYEEPQLKQIVVEMVRVRDGKKLTFSEKNKKDGFFTVNYDAFGNGGPTIIFQPQVSKIMPLHKEELFLVKVKGLTNRSGQPTTIEYPTLIY